MQRIYVTWRSLTIILTICLLWGAAGGALSAARADYPAETPAAPTGETVVKAEAQAAEEDKPTASFAVDLMSQYIWRGFALSRDSVVLQPSVTVGWKGFSVNIWGNFDTYEKNPFIGPPWRGGKWNETDFTLGYSRDIYNGDWLKAVTVSVGGIYYVLDGTANPQGDSFELYTGLAVDVNWFKLAAVANYEMFHYPGVWLTLGISRVFELPFVPLEGATLEVGNNILFLFSRDQAAYPDPQDRRLASDEPLRARAFSDPLAGQLYATLNLPVYKYVTISPKVGFWYALGGKSTYLLGGGGRNSFTGLSWDNQHNHVYGGVSVTFAF